MYHKRGSAWIPMGRDFYEITLPMITMSSSAMQQIILSSDQLQELNTLTANVERAMVPVIREREEQATDKTKKHLLKSIRSLKDV